MAETERPLRVERARDVREFERRAGDFLCAREAEHGLMLGICSMLRDARQPPADPPYFATVADGAKLVGAALRTPPNNLVLSVMPDPRAVGLVADDLVSDATELPGVLGEKPAAQRFAQLWGEHTGVRYRVKVAERIFRLTTVVPPRAAAGRLRVAEPADRDVATRWFGAFITEAIGPGDLSHVPATVDRWIARQGTTLYLWEDSRPVSMCIATGRTPSGIKISAVYTPPELRGRGYASSCVAAASQAQLDSGRRFCFLFTDLANPTSNSIYRRLGYEPVCDVDQYEFTREL